MKDPHKIVIAIADSGVFNWWDKEDNSLAKRYKKYFDGFEMEYKDFTSDKGEDKERSAGDHGSWVLDRILEVCGNNKKVKIINMKVFSRYDTLNEYLLNALDYAIGQEVDLLNLSLGVPRYARTDKGFVKDFNQKLTALKDKGGFTIISAGNEGEAYLDDILLENGNMLADDPDNNISVASHNIDGYWDKFSSVGGTVDVSLVGSHVELVGERSLSVVSGTSFSAPAFTGVCANYLIDQFTKLRSGDKSAKDIIYEHLDEAIQPRYKSNSFWKNLWTEIRYHPRSGMSPWFGEGSFESYAQYFTKHYGRGKLRFNLFGSTDSFRIM